MHINEIIDKLKDILSNELDNKKVFDKDVAASLNISKESLSIMKKKNSIPYEQIAKFCAKRKISINWVLFDQLPKSLEEETEKYTKIKYFNQINASAGGGGFNYDEDYELISIDKKILDSLYKSNSSKTESIIALNVTGDSMEPTLINKEIILFDKDNSDISKGGIFIVSTNIGLFVKRVSLKIDGSIELISDNKNYNSEIIQKSEFDTIQILGKVVGKVGLI
ncbi:LexA family transcriptional regulator [Aliarcobacter skirrowii]|uniref:LexA family transcriptional regulator n=1 Tax=Aliarcobacter skirrowii TaxID=28200 RepID=UPI0021B29BA0|nr:LexA family transcriptional regulator [Aliarcobacter skirrowii]MCT7447203.1 helix-turn-helix domain-containing protein [Aliarcobacter skirrowii]